MPHFTLDHTADLKIRFRATTLKNLFTEAFFTTMEILAGKSAQKSSARPKSLRQISLKSPDSTVLLIDFLNAILLSAQTRHEIYTSLTFKKLSANELQAEISGHPVMEFKEDIKAVTFHEAEIKRNKKGFLETNIVYDI